MGNLFGKTQITLSVLQLFAKGSDVRKRSHFYTKQDRNEKSAVAAQGFTARVPSRAWTTTESGRSLCCQSQRSSARVAGPVAAFVFAVKASVASACVVCAELPTETLTDDLWAAKAIVFARPSVDNEFAYAVTKVLRGVASTRIPFLVSSTARRLFLLDRDAVALILKTPEGIWELRGLGGRELLAFVQDALAHQEKWTDEQNDPDRAEAFRALHGHNSLTLRRVALTELSRVGYHELQKLEVALSADWIARRLSDPAWFGWQPVLVHLLGLHTDPRAHDLIRADAFKVGIGNRVPWLVALIEIDGRDGIDAVVAYATGEGRSIEASRAVVHALSIHAKANAPFAASLVPAFRRLATEDPDLAAEAALALIGLRDFSLAPDFSRILARGRVRNPASAFVLKHYVALARDEQVAQSSEAPVPQEGHAGGRQAK